MSLSGSWTLSMQTPMGLQTFMFIAKVEGTSLTGTIANGTDEPIEITDGVIEGSAASWKLTVKKPMPMTGIFPGREVFGCAADGALAAVFGGPGVEQ
jgi:hypothetical protein